MIKPDARRREPVSVSVCSDGRLAKSVVHLSPLKITELDAYEEHLLLRIGYLETFGKRKQSKLPLERSITRKMKRSQSVSFPRNAKHEKPESRKNKRKDKRNPSFG